MLAGKIGSPKFKYSTLHYKKRNKNPLNRWVVTIGSSFRVNMIMNLYNYPNTQKNKKKEHVNMWLKIGYKQ